MAAGRAGSYNETSLIEEDGTLGTLRKTSNRLSSTTVGNNNPPPERYVYDAHGSMTRVPHLGGAHPAPNIHWDYKDQLRQADLGGGGTAYYVYDASGQRARKVWEKSPGLTEERIYLGGFEIFRRRNGAGAVTLERETLHIMDDKQRIALVETRTTTTRPTVPAQLIRYQFGNHLGSASLELDDQAQIISYEEYTPTAARRIRRCAARLRRRSATAIPVRSGTRRVGCITTGRGTMRRGWGGGRVVIRREWWMTSIYSPTHSTTLFGWLTRRVLKPNLCGCDSLIPTILRCQS